MNAHDRETTHPLPAWAGPPRFSFSCGRAVHPIAAVIAWLLIGEAMPPLAWIGMAFAAAGVAVASRPSPCARRLDSGGEEQR